MPIVISSAVIASELNALVTQIGSSGSLLFLDASSNVLATFNLPNPAGVVFNNLLVFSGLPTAVAASSLAGVGAVPATMSIVSASGAVLVSGLPVSLGGSQAVVASSAANPGASFGIVGAIVSSAVI